MFNAYDIQKSPFVRITLPFIIGIMLYISYSEMHLYILPLYSLSVIIFLSSIFIAGIRNNYRFSSINNTNVLVLLLLSGYLYTSIFSINKKGQDSYDTGNIIAEIVESPQKRAKSTKIVVNIQAINNDNEWISTSGKAILYIADKDEDNEPEIGDRIIFEPILQEIKNPGNPHEFDYKKYLSYSMISKQAFLKSDQWQLLKSDKRNIKAYAEQLRKYIIHLYKKAGLSGNELAVSSALSIGYKDDLDASIKQSYSSSGAMHVLAVSGLHVGIIFMVFNYMLFFLNKNKKLKIIKAILLIVLLWGYASLTGLSPSVSRAATMFSFVVLGQMLNRHTNIYNSLAASAFLLLIIDPYSITKIGFQLSYMAVIGIVFFFPIIHSLIYVKNKWLDKLWSLIAVSIAAQLITAPISLYYFNQFPNYFMLTNVIVIPLGTIILYSIVFILSFSWMPIVLEYFGKVLSALVYSLNSSVEWIESLPGSVTSGISVSPIEVILLYLIIFSFTFFILHKRFYNFAISSISLIIIMIVGIINNYKINDRKEVYVYNIRGNSAINLIDGKNNMLFTDLKPDNSNYKFSMQNNWLKLGTDLEKLIPLSELNSQFYFSNLYYLNNPNFFYKNNYCCFYNTKFALINSKLDIQYNDEMQPLKMDFVILSNNANVSVELINQIYSPSVIILDSSNSTYRINIWKKQAKENNINLYILGEKGAFYKNISS